MIAGSNPDLDGAVVCWASTKNSLLPCVQQSGLERFQTHAGHKNVPGSIPSSSKILGWVASGRVTGALWINPVVTPDRSLLVLLLTGDPLPVGQVHQPLCYGEAPKNFVNQGGLDLQFRTSGKLRLGFWGLLRFFSLIQDSPGWQVEHWLEDYALK